jgi:hypothetical protein
MSEDIWGRLNYCNVVSLRKPCTFFRLSGQTDICSKVRQRGRVKLMEKTTIPCSTGWRLSRQFDQDVSQGGERETEPQKQSEKELPWNSRELPLVG